MTDKLLRPPAQSWQWNMHRSARWYPAALLLGCSLSAGLLLSWFLEPTRSLWLSIDDRLFWFLNGSLAGGAAWQGFWAAANNRVVDAFSALLMIGLFAHFARLNSGNNKDAIAAVFVLLVGLVIAGVQLGKAMPIDRLSPTLLYPGSLRLSELVYWIPTKDASADSFPGDHATALLIFAGVITLYLPRAYAALAWLIFFVFMTPRLVSGAHWLTDDLVGSVAVAGFVLSVVFATPLHRSVTQRLELLIGTMRVWIVKKKVKRTSSRLAEEK
jgi:membrane-associated phospholipid phosphatase